MNRNDKISIFWVWNVANYVLSSAKFLNYEKSSGLEVLTNIMSGTELPGQLKTTYNSIPFTCKAA